MVKKKYSGANAQLLLYSPSFLDDELKRKSADRFSNGEDRSRTETKETVPDGSSHFVPEEVAGNSLSEEVKILLP